MIPGNPLREHRCVAAHAAEHGRGCRDLPVQAEEIQSRCGCDAVMMEWCAALIKHGDVEPGVVRLKAGCPYHRGDGGGRATFEQDCGSIVKANPSQ